MDRLRRSSLALFGAAVGVVALVVWLLLPTPPDPGEPISLPWMIATAATMLAMAGLAVWANRQRFFRLAAAIVFSLTLAWSASVVLGVVTPGWPSPLVALWSAAVVMACTVAGTMRRQVWPWVATGLVLLVVFGVTYHFLGRERWHDMLGGLITGGLIACIANLVADVHVWRRVLPVNEDRRSAAVIYNPVKVLNLGLFQGVITGVLREYGYDEPLWLETEEDDPGIGMTRKALSADADLILIAGGDGTVRVALGELTNTGRAAAILPSGTGNLLARNLGIPLDLEEAVTLAVTREPTPLDMIRVDLLERTEYAAVLAGVGFDADVMGNTDENLKKAIGVGAYVVAGAQQLGGEPLHVELCVDDGEWIKKQATMVSIGNVGEIQEGVALMPAASAQDGKLDVLVLVASTARDMATMVTEALVDEQDGSSITRFTGSKVTVRTDKITHWQVDGDVIGEADEATFEVVPEAVQLIVP